MKMQTRSFATILVGLFSFGLLFASASAQAQAQRLVWDGVRWVAVAVAEDQILQQGLYPAWRAAQNQIARPREMHYLRPQQRQCGYIATNNGWGQLTYRRICQ